MKIAIAGAGIAGLASAALLARQGHDVELYDQFPAPQPVGLGLMIQPVGLKVLSRLGLEDRALAASSPIRQVLGLTAEGRRILDLTYAELRPDASGFAIQRAALFDMLLDAARSAGAELVP
ncbi:MAG: FAD-dependent monooxygenase, partial [Pseudomonadota bacterium]